ncbi:MAG: MTH938/NDUFAF3 family protein [Legionellaceae bacterium]|nr:MTH938/NDUFAF3 family protein [Legionellaceae bacterium]
MQIQLEAHETHTIQAYSNTEIKTNNVTYHTPLIISRDTLITPWNIPNAAELNQAHLQVILDLEPEVIILGTHTPDTLRRLDIIRQLAEKHIGVECMTIDAASRTFNILLSEHRRVVAGFMLGT